MATFTNKRKRSFLLEQKKINMLNLETNQRVRKHIRTRDDRPIWNLLKEFINKKANNTTITRKELHRYVYSDPDIARYMLNNSITVDTYRINLTHIGILQKTHKRGKYTKKRNIPPKLSTTALKNLASTVISGTWKSWFISIPDELKKYE